MKGKQWDLRFVNLKCYLRIVLIGVTLICIPQKSQAHENGFGQASSNRIRQAHWMEEVFSADTVLLRIPEKYCVGDISSILRMQDKQIIITDERYSNIVLFFDADGTFRHQIGRQGKGPGEYLAPKHVISDTAGHIIISDASLLRISFLDSDGTFLNSFSVQQMVWGLVALRNGNIAVHDQFASRIHPRKTIYIYNRQGEIVRKCGSTSSAYRKLRSIPYQTFGKYLVSDSIHLFEADYPDYHFRKYSTDCKSKKQFGQKPGYWKSLLSTHYKSISPPGGVPSQSAREKLDRYMKSEFHKCTHLRWIQYLSDNILTMAVKKNNSKDITRDYVYMFYDTDGNLLNERVRFRKTIVSDEYPYVKLMPASPDILCIAQFRFDDRGGFQRIRLIFLALK